MKLKPDVIVADIAMPVLNGLDAGVEVRAVWKEVKIIYLTMCSDPQVALRAFDDGASGFLLKSCAASDLRCAIRTVMMGGRYVSPTLQGMVERQRWEKGTEYERQDQLTPRQLEVLKLLADGKNMPQVAKSLALSFRTVAFHKYRLMARLGAKNDVDLVKYALRSGLRFSSDREH